MSTINLTIEQLQQLLTATVLGSGSGYLVVAA